MNCTKITVELENYRQSAWLIRFARPYRTIHHHVVILSLEPCPDLDSTQSACYYPRYALERLILLNYIPKREDCFFRNNLFRWNTHKPICLLRWRNRFVSSSEEADLFLQPICFFNRFVSSDEILITRLNVDKISLYLHCNTKKTRDVIN